MTTAELKQAIREARIRFTLDEILLVLNVMYHSGAITIEQAVATLDELQ